VQQHENTGGGLLTLRASWCLGSAEALSGSRAQFADLKQAVNMFRTSTQSLLDGRSGDAGGPSCACTHANAVVDEGLRGWGWPEGKGEGRGRPVGGRGTGLLADICCEEETSKKRQAVAQHSL